MAGVNYIALPRRICYPAGTIASPNLCNRCKYPVHERGWRDSTIAGCQTQQRSGASESPAGAQAARPRRRTARGMDSPRAGSAGVPTRGRRRTGRRGSSVAARLARRWSWSDKWSGRLCPLEQVVSDEQAKQCPPCGHLVVLGMTGANPGHRRRSSVQGHLHSDRRTARGAHLTVEFVLDRLGFRRGVARTRHRTSFARTVLLW